MKSRIFSVLASFSLLINSFMPLLAVSSVYAQELESTPTPEATSAPILEPEQTLSPTPSETQSLTIEESVNSSTTPTPSLQVSSEPAPPAGELSATVVHDLNFSNETGSTILTTDKGDYSPTDTVIVRADGFKPNTNYTLIITSEDSSAMHSEAPITTDENGSFIYAYQLDGNYRPNYQVEVKDSSGMVVAQTTFTDAAGASITLATGGSSISADTYNSSNYASLTGLILSESAVGQVGVGTIVLNVPTGFEFRTASSVTATRNNINNGTCSGQGNKVLKIGSSSGTSQTVTPSASQISISVSQASTGNSSLCSGIITWSGIAVRPSQGNPLKTGSITENGTSSITFANGSSASNFGSLTEVAGAVSISQSTVSASPTSIAADGTTTSTITVTLKDQFGNPVLGKTVTLAKTSGPVTPTITTISGTSNSSGQATFTVKGSTLGTDVLTAADATDNLSITQTASVTFADLVVPTVSAGSNITTNAQFTQTGSVADPAPSSSCCTYAWSKDSGPGTVTFGTVNTVATTVSVDANGTYVIRLTATDSAGNPGTSTFTLVWSTIAPTVTTRSDTIQKASFTVNGTATSGVAINSYQWSASSGNVHFSSATTGSTDISATSDGVYTVTLTAVDMATNSSSSSFQLTWDTTVPTLSSTTIATSNPNSLYAKTGDTITLSFTSSETIQTPTVNIAGSTVAATNTGSDWTASHIMAEGDSEGLITYTITFTDLAGNHGNTINTTSGITFDMTSPTIDLHDNLTVEASSADGASVPYNSPTTHDNVDNNGIASCSPASGLTFPLGDTNVICNTTDTAGNPATLATFIVNVVDTTPPLITLTGASNINLAINNSFADPGATAVDVVDGTNTVVVGGDTVNTAVAGRYTLTYDAADAAGNSATQKTRTVTVENTALPLTTTPNGDGTLSATISSATEASTTSSGVAVVFNIPAGTKITGPATWDGILTLPIATTTFTAPTSDSGFTASVISTTEIGAGDTQLTFDQSVKLTFTGQAGNLIGWSRGSTFTQIIDVCDTNDGNTTINGGTAFPDGGNCKISNDGSGNLIVWTKHFTTFITYTQTAVAASNNGGGEGGGGGNDRGDGLGCAVHDCSVHPAPQNLSLAVSTPGKVLAAGLASGVLGAEKEATTNEVKGESMIESSLPVPSNPFSVLFNVIGTLLAGILGFFTRLFSR